MNYRLLITSFYCIFMGLQLQAARMSDADLAKLRRVAPPGGLVISPETKEKQLERLRVAPPGGPVGLSDAEQKQIAINAEQKQIAANRRLFAAIEHMDDHTDFALTKLKEALKDGASVHARKNGNTALMQATVDINNHPLRLEVINILIQAGSDVNAQNDDYYRGDTALMYALNRFYKDAVKLLLNAGADITLKNSEGKTALDLAKSSLEYLQRQVNHLEKPQSDAYIKANPWINGLKKSTHQTYLDAVEIIKMLEEVENKNKPKSSWKSWLSGGWFK
ncbi:MAG: ankyrin repeat domain-containing protein [Candidatus Babeliales bacterium]|nr:ankyrin repeat domain-containing protein [Candidatus Babeliales bacterium]